IARSENLIQAGGMSFGITIVVACGGLIGPISTVMLPYAVRKFNSQSRHSLCADTVKMTVAIFSLGLLLYVSFLGLSDAFVRRFLGPEYLDISIAIKIVTFAAIPYSIFV